MLPDLCIRGPLFHVSPALWVSCSCAVYYEVRALSHLVLQTFLQHIVPQMSAALTLECHDGT